MEETNDMMGLGVFFYIVESFLSLNGGSGGNFVQFYEQEKTEETKPWNPCILYY
jgi:hypothetical protein